MDNIHTRIVSLPHSVKGYVAKDSDGNYNIYLNANLTYETQLEAFQHELHHIEENHFHRDKNFLVCEDQAEYG